MSGGGLEQAAQGCLIEVLNMSLTASVMILAVLAARMFLKRAPRLFSYALWAVVLFRLLCPVSFAAPLSLLGALQNEAGASGRMEYVPEPFTMRLRTHRPRQSGRQKGAANKPRLSKFFTTFNSYYCRRFFLYSSVFRKRNVANPKAGRLSRTLSKGSHSNTLPYKSIFSTDEDSSGILPETVTTLPVPAVSRTRTM